MSFTNKFCSVIMVSIYVAYVALSIKMLVRNSPSQKSLEIGSANGNSRHDEGVSIDCRPTKLQ